MHREILDYGSGRTKVFLAWDRMGEGITIRIFNEGSHIGAVAVGEYCASENRTSGSVITRLGHKDDIIALTAAHRISKQMKTTSCVIVGIHLDHITLPEIDTIQQHCNILVNELIDCLCNNPLSLA